MEQSSATNNKINKPFFLFVIVVFGLLLLYSMSEFFTAFLGSIMFYVLFKPWMEFLVKKKKWKKGRAAILIVMISFFIIMLPILLFFSMLYNKISGLILQPEIVLNYIKQIQINLNVELLNEENIAQIQSRLATVVPGILNVGLSFFSSVVMMYFLMYFFTDQL